jgi:pimeloyl-ACP methyl ester carboxylesterase
MRAFVLPLVLLYPLYGGVMYTQQEAILFPAASNQHHVLHAALPANAELVELPASFGNVRATYLRANPGASAQPAILYLHGNFERIEDSFNLLQPLVAAGISVLQLEYPGYGGADGAPSHADLAEAADLAYDWLAFQRDVDAQRIIVMGYSIGGGIAAELAMRRRVPALVLLSTYTSMEAMAHRYLLPGFLVRYPYDTLARLREYPGPVFIEHGRNDKVIPFAMGEALASAAGARGQFTPLECGHDDCHFDRSLFAERLPTWLRTHQLLNP